MGYFSGWFILMRGGWRWWFRILIHYIICLSFFSSKMGVMSRSSNETDRLALLAFKAKITDDPFGIMRLWNDSTPFCGWYGVTCGTRHLQRVTQLNLVSLKLGGSIPPHIGNLSFLHVLQLYNNNFIHRIPPEIGRLRRLRVLNLMNNTLGGKIPVNLSSCMELTSLTLSNNQLQENIPLKLGFLSKLLSFGASENRLTGALPVSFGNLTVLEELLLAYNNLVGQIPKAFGSLIHLTQLSVGANFVHGEVPSSIFNFSSLEVFDIGDNQIGGRLPPDMFQTLPNLFFFAVDGSQFIGTIPVSISNASNLQVLQLFDNKFVGKVPSLQSLNTLRALSIYGNQLGSGAGAHDDLSFLCSLTNATTLTLLQMDTNNFGGVIPQCITNLSSHLMVLTIFNNYISGSIPLGIDNLIGLQALSVSNNSFRGPIPPTIGNLENLSILYLDNNNFSGLIPSSLGKLSKLLSLDLSFNSLEGLIPSNLQNCTSLQTLGLSHNGLNGSIPTQIFSMPSLSLQILVSHNHLTGSLPKELGELTNLYMLDVSANMLYGQLPDVLGKCTSMEFLGLYSNNFQGPIPSSWSTMRGLQVLDLSYNNISGLIPAFLASFDYFTVLNLSFNDLSGSVPKTGVFTNVTAISLQGNNKLCGGIPRLHLPACRITLDRKTLKLSLKIKVIIAIAAGLACVGLLILLVCVFVSKRKQGQTQEALVAATSQNLPLQFVSYGDLYRATNGFSEANLVGIGSFGQVYRGVLHEGGQVLAIKVLKLERVGASKSFVAECEALRNIRHRNLVKLITVCASIDYQGNEFKALIYEFMPSGSLEDWLHPPATREMPHRKLGLIKRVGIAIDVASLLEYVHHEFGTPLVHCDIKPSNILLDGELFGRVGDFGLAKFLSDCGIIRSSAQPSSSIGVRGTVGYAPPEYGLGSKVSTEGDVYSFGILLLEMFTGKRPNHEMFKEGLTLHVYAKTALPTGVVDILDPTLCDLPETDEQVLNPRRSTTVLNCLVLLIEIGVACSLESPAERIDMNVVTPKLRTIRDHLVKGKK